MCQVCYVFDRQGGRGRMVAIALVGEWGASAVGMLLRGRGRKLPRVAAVILVQEGDAEMSGIASILQSAPP